jgi:5-formyltetrahydrofolate cyclo-ligase
MDPADGTASAKRTARARALAARDAIPAGERARLSAAVCARAAALPELRAAKALALFAAFRTEIDTSALIAWALEARKTVGLPRVLGAREMAMVRVEDPAADLVPGTWGIPEPRPDLPVLEPQVFEAVVVPGAAFALDGARCGYGGGFYDAYLPRLAGGTPRVALAFEAQVVAELPREPHDLLVDAIVTETRVIRPA